MMRFWVASVTISRISCDPVAAVFFLDEKRRKRSGDISAAMFSG